MLLRFFLIQLITFSVVLALDLQVLQEKSESKDSKFLSEIISKTKIYENISKIPNDLKPGNSFIVEDDYGTKFFYVLNNINEMEEFSHPFFGKLLNLNSGSTYNNMFATTMGKEYDPSAKDSFREYVSETETVRVRVVDIPARPDHAEKALNDYLLDNNINPSSVINIQMISENEKKKLWIFYRP